nr:spore coat associated protein CotJA [Clostridia bacterium]
MERNENGYPLIPRVEDCRESDEATLHDMPIGYAYVPVQRFRMIMKPEDALAHGTMFEELYKPLGVYGNE